MRAPGRFVQTHEDEQDIAGEIVGFNILAQIDLEISRLKAARTLLEKSRFLSKAGHAPKKRNLTPEGRRRIVEAVKRRWALQRQNS